MINKVPMTRPSDDKKKKKQKEKKEERTYQIADFAVPVNHRIKIKESEKYLDLDREVKKTIEYEGDGDINCN